MRPSSTSCLAEFRQRLRENGAVRVVCAQGPYAGRGVNDGAPPLVQTATASRIGDWRRRASEHEVEPRFAFDPRQELLVALGRLGDDLFVRLALAGLEPQLRVQADEVTKLPAVAVDNVPNDVADHGGWNGFGERGGEQGAKPPPVRVETVRWRWRRFGEDRRGDDSGLHDGDAHVEGAHLLGEALAQRLEGPFRRGVARHWRASQAARNRGDVDDGSLAPLAHARDHRLDAPKTAEEIGFHRLAKLVERCLFHGAATGDSGVVDENVDRSKLSDDSVEGFANGCVVIDVERDQMNWKLFFLGYSADFCAAIQISQRRGDRMPRAREGDGGR